MDYAKAAAAVQQYMDGLTGEDVSVIVDLYADNAQIEDPIGSDIVSGREAITQFYGGVLASIQAAELSGPIRVAANEVAFPFQITIGSPDAPMYMDIIDVFKFNDAGKVELMRAFWGPENTRT
jgi:steroid delta-isomerase